MAEQRKLSVLVTDDEESVRNILVRTLSKVPNLDISTATNGQEAYDKIRGHKPDILCTDVMMPSMNGGELLEKLAAESYKIPNFVITGTPITPEAARAAFYSCRLYTNEQAHILKLPPLQSTVNAQMEYMAAGEMQDNDFGFNVLVKPSQVARLMPRIRILKQLIYGS